MTVLESMMLMIEVFGVSVRRRVFMFCVLKVSPLIAIKKNKLYEFGM